GQRPELRGPQPRHVVGTRNQIPITISTAPTRIPPSPDRRRRRSARRAAQSPAIEDGWGPISADAAGPLALACASDAGAAPAAAASVWGAPDDHGEPLTYPGGASGTTNHIT